MLVKIDEETKALDVLFGVRDNGVAEDLRFNLFDAAHAPIKIEMAEWQFNFIVVMQLLTITALIVTLVRGSL